MQLDENSSMQFLFLFEKQVFTHTYIFKKATTLFYKMTITLLQK